MASISLTTLGKLRGTWFRERYPERSRLLAIQIRERGGKKRTIEIGEDTAENRTRGERRVEELRWAAKASAAGQDASLLGFREIALDFLERGMTWRELAPSTQEDRRSHLGLGKRIDRTFGERTLSGIGERDIEMFFLGLVHEEGLAEKTAKNHLDSLADVFHHAKKHNGFDGMSPVAMFRETRRKEGNTKAARARKESGDVRKPIEDLEALQRMVDKSAELALDRAALVARNRHGKRERFTQSVRRRDPRKHVATVLLLDSGIRLGEALALRWGHISLGTETDAASRTIRVSASNSRGRDATGSTKSGRSRSVAMSLRLRELLIDFEEWLVDCGRKPCSGDLILGIDPANWRNRHFKRACVLAELGDRSPKDLRDTFASQLLTCGVQLAYVSQQLGHASVEVTAQRYARWADPAYRIPMETAEHEVPADLIARLGG